MTTFLIIAAMAVAQDLEALSGKLIQEGASAKLAALLGTEHGRAAVQERIDYLVSARVGRIERDPAGAYEDHLFSTDENGRLVPRPERKEEFDRLALETAQAPRAMEGFTRRCDVLAAKIGEATDLDKRAKAWWRDEPFRIAFFHAHSDDLRELDDAGLIESFVLKGLVPRDDGKVIVGSVYGQAPLDFVRATRPRLDAMKEFEKAYLKLVIAEKDEAVRKAVGADSGILFVLGRLTRQVDEGDEESIGGLLAADPESGEKGLSFNLELAEFMEPIEQCEKLAAEVQLRFEEVAGKIAADGANEAEVVEFLMGRRARMLVAERMMALKKRQKAKAEAVFKAVREDGFEGVAVRKGRYKDENGNDSPDVLDAEHQMVVDDYLAGRNGFDLIAERCADPASATLFESVAGTFVLQGHQAGIVESLKQAAQAEGFGLFVNLYLEKKGEEYGVRPERARKIDDLAARAADIKKSMQ